MTETLDFLYESGMVLTTSLLIAFLGCGLLTGIVAFVRLLLAIVQFVFE